MNASRQAEYRERLLALRDRFRDEVEARNEEISDITGDSEQVMRAPTHPADEDIEGLDVEEEVMRVEQSMYDQVEAALDRIDAGEYGTCESCGREISLARLDEIPYASMCVECANRLAVR